VDWTSLQADVVVRVALAVALGGAVGLEREIHGRPAGLRTHVIVCLAAAMMMVAGQGIAGIYRPGPGDIRITIDPGRIAAGIVTGIGFLGAGAILRAGDAVRGLTTAGCIWFVAGLGIVIGEGFYLLAVISTVLALVALKALDAVERRIPRVVYRSVSVVLPADKATAVLARCQEILQGEGVRVQDVSHHSSQETGRAEATFYVRTRNHLQAPKVIGRLMQIPEVQEARWSLP